MKPFLLLIILLLPALPAKADSIDLETARRTALQFLRADTSHDKGPWPARRQTAALVLKARNKAAYLFSAGAEGFVLAAADDCLPPVLGYGPLSGGTLPPALHGLIAAYGTRLRSYPDSHASTPAGSTGPASRNIGQAAGDIGPVSPLLTTIRHQRAPYNGACPYYRHSDGSQSPERCLVGCVATALEQVITYYRRTVTLQDTLHGWSTARYDIPDVLPGATIDTRLILDDYDRRPYSPEQADAVARLSYYCGMAARMNWGVGASGARIDRLVGPLRRAFGFGYVRYADSYKYAPDAWERMLDNELRNGRPVVLTGFGMGTNGHAFVLDGRDSDGFFHVNWGEGGMYDGFFRLDVLNPAEPKNDITDTGMTEGVAINLEALLLHPDPIGATLPDTLERTGLETVIDSIRLEQIPEAGKYTPIRIFFRNTADRTLTTPFEIFTNAPTDADIFADADYVALTGVTLQPGERQERLVHASFTQTGDRILRLSPDDRAVPFEQPVKIAAAGIPELSFGIPEAVFPEQGTAVVRASIANPGPGRAGHRVTFELVADDETRPASAAAQDASDTGRKPFTAAEAPYYAGHVLYTYLPAGQEETAEIRFTGLIPGTRYTLNIRCPWTTQQTLVFSVPDTGTGIGAFPETPAPTQWYTPDGRRVAAPAGTGLYLRRRDGRTEKVFVRQ